MATTTLKNPKELYYNDKFPAQDQRAPALQKNMKPVPDCGEESYVGTGKLKGRKALITGGDSGIGRAAAIAFAREGADVAIGYLPGEQEDAEQVKGWIEKAGRRAVLLPGDLEDDEYARNVVDEAAKALAGLDILVLNAAEQIAVPNIEELPIEQVRRMFDVNIISMFVTAQRAMKYLPSGASIITTTSVNSIDPSEDLLDYSTTKGAIVTFTKGLAKQLAPKGIRVNSVSPGPVWTALQLAGGQPEDELPEFGQNSPIGRAGQPVELAPVYVFLASQDASFVTGQVYGVTGGKLSD